MTALGPRLVHVPFDRVTGWIERYDVRHPDSTWTVTSQRAGTVSPDGSTSEFDIPFAPLVDLSVAGLVAHLGWTREIGVLLVRRGGFAVARVVGADIVESKIGQRHVQGRTKAGGWSQQRFARRRDNQAREAYEAAAGHAARILAPRADGLQQLVVGGDRPGVESVLEDQRLTRLTALPRLWVGAVADPRRGVLIAAVERARSVEVRIDDAVTERHR